MVVFTLAVLLFAEWLSRAKHFHSELTRKFVHIVVGTMVAFWPFVLSWGKIQLLSAAFLIVILLSTKFNIFRSIHAVKREAYGEIAFALAIGFLAFICTSKWIFAASMLALSLADGMAAVIGTIYGRKNGYKVFGRQKSIIGTTTFFVIAFLIVSVYGIFSGGHSSLAMLFFLPLLATAAENLSGGFDNIVIPVLFAIFLSSSI